MSIRPLFSVYAAVTAAGQEIPGWAIPEQEYRQLAKLLIFLALASRRQATDND
jgi:hypothetical protein